MTEALHHDSGKLRYSLLPSHATTEVVRVMEYGATKYAPENYLKGGGLDVTRLWDSCMRHMWAVRCGELVDPESGCPHMSHVAADAMMMREIILMRERTLAEGKP